jgi:hypothetical protein
MASRIDFSPLANPMLNAPLAVSILENYDPYLQAAVDYSSPFRGQKFSVLVLAEYSEQCKTNGIMHRGEADRPDWARDYFDRSALYRMVAVHQVFSKIIRDPRGEYLVFATQIRDLTRALEPRAGMYTGITAGSHVLPGGAALAAGAISRGHIPVGRGGAIAAPCPSSPRAHVAVGSAAAPYGFPASSRGAPSPYFTGGSAATGAPVARGPAPGDRVGVGSRAPASGGHVGVGTRR